MSNHTREEIASFLKEWAKPLVEGHRKGFILQGIMGDTFENRGFIIKVGMEGRSDSEHIPVTFAMADDAMGSWGDKTLREHVNGKLFQCFPTEGFGSERIAIAMCSIQQCEFSEPITANAVIREVCPDCGEPLVSKCPRCMKPIYERRNYHDCGEQLRFPRGPQFVQDFMG